MIYLMMKNLSNMIQVTLNQLFQEYIELIDLLQSEQTIRTKKGYYRKHIKEPYGDKNINDLKYKDFQTLINNLLKSGLKPKTVKNIKDLLQVIYKMAIKLEYTSYNPLLDVELPKFDNKRYFSYSLEHQQKLIKAILNFQEPIYKDIFLFLLHGRRLNEVLSIQWEMIDLNEKIYYIPAKINKAKRNMSYSMTDELFEMLTSNYIQAKKEQKLSIPLGYVFKNPKTGKKFVDLRKAWKRLLKTENLPHTRIHDIRHLVGTYSINHLEIPIEKVSHTLGHTSIEVTQKYITINPDTARDVCENIFNSIKN